jgi:phenylacetate-CoA ligase
MEDTLYKLLNIYHNLPPILKTVIGKAYGLLPKRLKYGKFYALYLNRIKYFQSIKDPALSEALQHKLLIENVSLAIKNIPYYQNFGSIDTILDFKQLPIVDKYIIQKNKKAFINKKLKPFFIKTNTGGSSGTPFEFFRHKNQTRPKETAHFHWYWRQFGYEPGDKVLMIRGRALRKNSLFEYQAIDNKLVISSFTLNDDNIELVLKEINKFKPKFIHAYPSALKILTDLIKEPHKISQLNFDAIFLGSEYLSTDYRSYFQAFYKAPVVNWYGHSECLVHAGNCSKNNKYHFYPFYGFVELLDDQGLEITEPGNVGRIIATGFDNQVMPLIRYDTNDLGVLSKQKDCECGFKGLTLDRIEGRNQDYIYLKDGQKISLTSLIFGQHFAEFERIIEFQIQQEVKGKIKILIVKKTTYSDRDEKTFKEKVYKIVNNKLDISFIYKDKIPKTLIGKHIFLIQNIKSSS